jgi:maltose/maltodextrin transport system substrate-binding protein
MTLNSSQSNSAKIVEPVLFTAFFGGWCGGVVLYLRTLVDWHGVGRRCGLRCMGRSQGAFQVIRQKRMKNLVSASGPAGRCGGRHEEQPLSVFPRVWHFIRLLAVVLLSLQAQTVRGWKNGELLVWMDNERGRAVQTLGEQFERDLGITVTVETPERITDSFPIAAQAGKGPDIVIWAHDKVAEWADSGLIAPVMPSSDFTKKFFPQAWQAVSHGQHLWGYPIALETVTLIYNRKFLNSDPPAQLAQIPMLSRHLQQQYPGVRPILWEYTSAYYSWGLLASAGAYVFQKRETDYDVTKTGVNTPGAVEAVSQIVGLVRAGILPSSVVYSYTEELMGQGKLAMMFSGPWAWANLIAKSIDFGVAPLPGVGGHPGRPFVGVTAAYFNCSSPNQDLAQAFLERYVVTPEGIATMNRAKAVGVPALVQAYESLARNDARVRELKACVELGELMPNVPRMGRFFSALTTALQLTTGGRISPQAALDDAAQSIDSE